MNLQINEFQFAVRQIDLMLDRPTKKKTKEQTSEKNHKFDGINEWVNIKVYVYKYMWFNICMYIWLYEVI